MNSLSVVIPSKNAANLTECLKALRWHEPNLHVVVVDDGLAFRPEGFQVEYVSGVKPFVFARNVNIGIAAAGSSDVVILNDDAKLQTSGGFNGLQYMAYKTAGVLSAACNNVGNPNQWRQKPPYVTREENRTLCFVCVCIPRHVLIGVGLLDERFTDYGLDDDDYCLRVRRAGYKLGVFDGCYVDHGSLTSSYRGEAGAGGDFKPNLRRFIEKWSFDNWNQPKESSQWPELFP